MTYASKDSKEITEQLYSGLQIFPNLSPLISYYFVEGELELF